MKELEREWNKRDALGPAKGLEIALGSGEGPGGGDYLNCAPEKSGNKFSRVSWAVSLVLLKLGRGDVENTEGDGCFLPPSKVSSSRSL